MAGAVTYADLRFTKAPVRGSRQPESSEDNESGQLEMMYENVSRQKDQQENTENPTPEKDGQCSFSTGFRSHLLTSLLFVLCLIFIWATIGFGVKYNQITKELQQLSANQTILKSHLSETIEIREERLREINKELTQTKLELTQVTQDRNDYNTSLQKCQQGQTESRKQINDLEHFYSTTLQEKKQAEKSLQDIQSRIKTLQQGLKEFYL
ncbi:B-cell differentiation antigen CD72 [Bombina bombina]|uniref:B-cell differentiation antigen CD72 n=1 Tax=Bombina bombina TaxID=8345 RepID=UPI00235AEB19|nr:B-cell differentiation antigen CD72 [Bombina bombina]